MTGAKFGYLTVIDAPTGVKHSKVGVRCDCGVEKNVRLDHLRSGKVVACGCFMRRRQVEANRTHGLSHTPTWNVWRGMHTRCTNKRAKAYKDYGARGIRVCDRWKDFECFLADMGECPAGRSIERLDVDGDYCPSNCEWIKRAAQNRNKRDTVWIEVNGRKQSVAEACERLGLPRYFYDNRRKKHASAAPQQVFEGMLVDLGIAT